ncbi:MAG: ATP-binding protein [Bacteroidales bacterium]|jgi:energy-coupling factor transporter ATP-binding protein EcfA2|nr:ATP-binding protein [Bacteroidales bacterium]
MRDKEKHSPFVFGGSTSSEMFTDREEEAKRLNLNFEHGINTILISPRRWGKTSLIQKVRKIAHSDTLKIVCIDVFACKCEEDFYRLFAVELIKQTANKWEEWMDNAKRFLSALVPKISVGIDPQTDFSISLDFSDKKINEEILKLPQKIAEEKDITIVVCFDEFQQIAEFPEQVSFQKKLRSVWQLQNKVSYCLFGSKKHVLSTMFSKQSMPFYKFGDIIYLQKIKTEDWISFIVQRFAVSGKLISEHLSREICTYVENHSYYVQQLAWLTWIRTENEVQSEYVEAAKIDLLQQNSNLYYQYVAELTRFQMNFLFAICDNIHTNFTRKEVLNTYNIGTSTNVQRIKKSLEDREIIDITDGKVYFNDPVFKLWFMKNVRR